MIEENEVSNKKVKKEFKWKKKKVVIETVNHWVIQKLALIAEERNANEWITQGEREKWKGTAYLCWKSGKTRVKYLKI